VTSEIYTTDILDKEHFWTEELMKVNQDFLFGCSTGVWGRGKLSASVPSPILMSLSLSLSVCVSLSLSLRARHKEGE
jgi:hypothetical protein